MLPSFPREWKELMKKNSICESCSHPSWEVCQFLEKVLNCACTWERSDHFNYSAYMVFSPTLHYARANDSAKPCSISKVNLPLNYCNLEKRFKVGVSSLPSSHRDKL